MLRRRAKRCREMDGRHRNRCKKLQGVGLLDESQARGLYSESAATRPVRIGRRPSEGTKTQAPRLLARLPLLLIMMLSMLLLLLLLLFGLAKASGSLATVEGPQQDAVSTVILRSEHNHLFRGQRVGNTDSLTQLPAGDVIEFLGIRYAAAPIKRLRFMPPSPFNYAPNQLHEARRPGAICMQRPPVHFSPRQAELLAHRLAANNRSGASGRLAPLAELQLELTAGLTASERATGRLLGQLLSASQSEDCLNLNIHAPAQGLHDRLLLEPEVPVATTRGRTTPNELRPVLIVIHGRSFDYGAGATIEGARAFARQNGLLVVTFNYRLNLLGFPPRLAAGGARTNLGLLDQVALLHWVQANIRSFGGSPRNVTLLGLGRGAIFVNLLMLTPLAKGLFQRAIMEDGTALSPLLTAAAHQQVGALQHLRLLALMAECPAKSNNNSSGTNAAAAAAAAVAFECLRAAPAEMLMQPVPVGLLDAGASLRAGQFVLARRWHKPLEQLFRRLLELDQQQVVPADVRANLNELANRIIRLDEEPTAADGKSSPPPPPPVAAVALDASQLDQLIVHLVATRQLIRQAAPQTQTTSDSSAKALELLDELLSAIYLPSNETLAEAMFAPSLELPSLAAPHDANNAGQLVALMLARQSTFGAHDLLIGSSECLIDLPPSLQLQLEPEVGQKQQFAQELADCGATNGRPLAVPPMERFSGRVQRHLGLTDAQAIQQVGLFVRTHFRFHQQEISNSIINSYFLDSNSAGQSATVAPQQSATSGSGWPAAESPRRTKQLQVLRALRAAYRDALVGVPLIKTALVHSLKQLELLGELFASQQLFEFNHRLHQIQSTGSGSNGNQVLRFLAEEQRRVQAANQELELEFHHFVRALYNETNMWPLQLVHERGAPPWNSSEPPDRESDRPVTPRATYLYQFGGLDTLVRKLELLVRKLDSSDSQRSSLGWTLASLRANLVNNLLTKVLQIGDEFLQELGLACSLTLESGASAASLVHRFKALLCARLGSQVLTPFVAHGNVNSAPRVHNFQLEQELDKFELDCGHKQPIARASDNRLTLEQHHSVGPSTSVGEMFLGTLACRERLDELSLSYLAHEFELEPPEGASWPVFNVFSQQLASFGAPPVWQAATFAGSAASQARAKLDHKIAFWANFIPTLNCSRTQPISSQSLARAHNATLLNMNLNFDCQQPGGTTSSAQALLQAVAARLKQTLADHINALLRQYQQQQQQRDASAVIHGTSRMAASHHSLRMAAASGNESQLDEFGAASRQLNSSLESWLALDSRQAELRPTGVAGRWATALLKQPPVVAAALIVFLSVLLAGALIVTNQKRQRAKETPKADEEKRDESPSSSNCAAHQNHAPRNNQSSSPASLAAQTTPAGSNNAKSNNIFTLYNPSEQVLLEQAATSFMEPTGAQYLDNPHPHHHHPPPHHHNHNQQQQQQQHFSEHQINRGQVLLPIISSSHNWTQQQQPHEHLAGCNLLQGKPQAIQQQQAMSSSSETTTSATNRAHSSVSLFSSSTNTTIANNSTAARQTLTKKRVKISDPKRRQESNCTPAVHSPAYSAAGEQVYLAEGGGAGQLELEAAGQQHLCPIHRTSSAYSFLPLEYAAFLPPAEHPEAAPDLVAPVNSLADYLNLRHL